MKYYISYDISDTKLRTKLSKFLSKYGTRLQLSMFYFDIPNKDIKVILNEIKDIYHTHIGAADSILFFEFSDSGVKKNKKFEYVNRGYGVGNYLV